MKIAEVKELDLETTGFKIQAKLLNAWEIKEYNGKFGAFKKQGIQLVDGEEKIIARISSGFVSKKDIGKDIEISGCILGEYNDTPQIDTNDKSVVTIERTKTTGRVEEVSPPKAFLNIVTEAFEETQIILEHPAFARALKTGKELGLENDDIRSLVIHRLIGK